MSKFRWNVLLLAVFSAAWACVFYTSIFATFFWWVFPAVMFGAVSTAVLCGTLEGGAFTRPTLALVPPALITPYLAFSSFPDPAFGYMPLLLFLFPCLAVSAICLLVALYRRMRPNNSFKPNPLRGSA
jgi:hypothetical protein